MVWNVHHTLVSYVYGYVENTQFTVHVKLIPIRPHTHLKHLQTDNP